MNDMPTFDVSSIPAEFNPLMQHQPLDGGQAGDAYAQDSKLFVTFATVAVLHPYESTMAGRPICKDQDMITIRAPGSRDSIVAPVKYYMDRFGEKYRAWKSTQMQAADGTPLENYPFLFTKPSLIAELKYRNIFTVEQLASLSDTAKQTIMGGHELCKRALDWLEQTSAVAMDVEKEEMRRKMAAMEEQLAALVALTQSANKGSKSKAEAKGATAPAEAPAFLQPAA